MLLKKNQKGFTLVELIIAAGILAVVAVAVGSFIVVGSRSYAAANTDIMLQQDAQLALNQISDVIIDTTDSINYSLKEAGGTDMQLVLKDSEFAGEAEEKCLAVVNKKEADSVNDNPSYWFYWSKADETIYFNEVHVDSSMTEEEIEAGFNNADTDKAILAQHVADFSVDLTQFDANRVVMISMLFQNNGREYETSNNITVRNRIALNLVTVDPMRRATEFTITVDPSVILEPGDHYTFDPPHVEGVGVGESTAVRWQLAAAEQNGTTITSDGELRIGDNETREKFKVQVTRAEYADANSTKEVTVEIKRVNEVRLSAEGDRIATGETITINSSVIGWKLGTRCEAYDCALDDLSKDKDVTDWVVTGPASITEGSDGKTASLSINNDAEVGSEIVVRATSLLSKNKPYDDVIGELRLIINEGGASPHDGVFFFGDDNTHGTFDYTFGDIPVYGERYLMYARIREMDSNTKDNDKVILYYSGNDRNLRFFPDMFGLDLSRSYKLYLQAILPIEKSKHRQGNGSEYDTADKILTEVIYTPANIDGSGKYIGSKYYASEYMAFLLTPPTFTAYYNESNSDEFTFVNKDSSPNTEPNIMGGIYGRNDQNMTDGGFNGNIRISVYEGEGDSISGWKWISGYDPGSMQYKSYSFANDMFTFHTGSGFDLITSSIFLTRNNNSKNIYKDLCGTYHFVLGYEYANAENASKLKKPRTDYQFLYKSPNLNGDYTTHYYPLYHNNITFEVKLGLNLQLYDENNQEVWTTFPAPTDAAFPFASNSSAEQRTDRKFYLYKKSWDGSREYYSQMENGNFRGMQISNQGLQDNITVSYKYMPGVGGDSARYTIALLKETFNGKSKTTKTFGTYVWDGKDNWIQQSGYSEKTDTIVPNMIVSRGGINYETYFPAPTESGFPFAATSGTQTTSYTLTEFRQYNDWDSIVETATVNGTYTGSGYEIEVIAESVSGHKKTIYNYGKFRYNSAGKRWEQSSGSSSSFREEEYWGTYVIFYYQNESRNMRMELPLPGKDGIPALAPGQSYITTMTQGMYEPDDKYGDKNPWYTPSITFKATYTLNAAGTQYTVTLSESGWQKVSGTWTYTIGTDTNWR